jgi:uncharacterized protein YndB with AHSA1/START domain
MIRDLKFEAFYPHPPEKVWRVLTDPELIAKWLMPNDFAPILGHRFKFQAPPQPGWDGRVDCEVTLCDPPVRLAYTWRNNLIDTHVRFDLREADGGTWLLLEHKGFTGLKGLFVSMILGSGWKGIVHKHIGRLLDRLDEEQNEDGRS